MPAIQIQTQISTDDILYAIDKWHTNELEQFVYQILLLRAKRKAPSFSHNESNLRININKGIPDKIQNRFYELILKRDDETLTNDEYKELLRLTDEIENFDAKRVEYLSKLAKLRKTTVSKLMDDLDIKRAGYA